MEVLIQARRQGLLVLCEVVYAEVTPAFESRAELDKVLADLGAHLDPIGAEAAWLAAKDRGYLRRYFPDLAVLRP